MKNALRSLVYDLYAFYLGGSLAIIGYSYDTWQFYFIVVPTILLVVIFKRDKQ